MHKDSDRVSTWFASTAGVRVHASCPECHSTNIGFHKVRTPGLTGISRNSQGLAPACIECGHSLPNISKKSGPSTGGPLVKIRVY